MVAIAPVAPSRPVVAPAKPATTSDYWPQLDGVRSIGFLAVFIVHAGPIPGAANAFVAAFNWFSHRCSFGLDLFFALSGYLITTLLLREKDKWGSISYRSFYTKRALRIWPIYFGFVVIAGCLILPLFSLHHLSVYWKFLLQAVLPLSLFVANFTIPFNQIFIYKFGQEIGIPIGSLILPCWSLCVEEQFYLFCPLLLNRISNVKKLFGMLASLAVLSIAVRFVLYGLTPYLTRFGLPKYFYHFNTIAHMEPLLLGTAIGLAFFRFPAFLAWSKNHAGIFLATLGLLASLLFMPGITLGEVPKMSVEAYFCAVILILVLVYEPFKKTFSNPTLVALGKRTYCMYLIHFPIMSCTKAWLTDSVHLAKTPWFWVVNVSLTLVATIVLSLISWELVEKRFLSMKKLYNRA